jgi:hypothetical protein
MAEEKAISRSNAGTTYFAKAQSEITLQEQGGRYSTGTVVTGTTPIPAVPTLPPSSPWSQSWGPPEAPFDVDISYVEPVGTPAEIEASLKVEATVPQPTSLPSDCVDPASTAAIASTDVVAPAAVDAAPLPSGGGGATFRLKRL